MCEIAISGRGWEVHLQFDPKHYCYVASSTQKIGYCVRVADRKTMLSIDFGREGFCLSHPDDEVFNDVLDHHGEIICTYYSADEGGDFSATFRQHAS